MHAYERENEVFTKITPFLQKKAARMSVPQFGGWDQKAPGPTNYSVVFSQARANKKHQKTDLTEVKRNSLGNEQEVGNSPHHPHGRAQTQAQVHGHGHGQGQAQAQAQAKAQALAQAKAQVQAQAKAHAHAHGHANALTHAHDNDEPVVTVRPFFKLISVA